MFETLKKRWTEARVAPVSEFVADILQRYQQMNPLDRYAVSSAFDETLSRMEDQTGCLEQWTSAQKQEAAKAIMRAAREAGGARGDNMEGETMRLGANGSALLSFYLELQTLPGNQAMELLETIEEWRKDRTGPYYPDRQISN